VKPRGISRRNKMYYMKYKINELATNSKNKNIRDMYIGITEFRSSSQHRRDFVKDDNGDLLADSCKILNKWKNYPIVRCAQVQRS
jgi:hypothetical protein